MDELHNLFWLSAAYNFHISAIYIEGARNTIADVISCLHDPRHLHNFYALLRDHLPQIAVDQLRLNDHMLVHSSSFVFSRCSEKLKEFQTLVVQFRKKHRASKHQLQ